MDKNIPTMSIEGDGLDIPQEWKDAMVKAPPRTGPMTFARLDEPPAMSDAASVGGGIPGSWALDEDIEDPCEFDMEATNAGHVPGLSGARDATAAVGADRTEEVRMLRQRLADVSRIVGALADEVRLECDPVDSVCHDHDLTPEGECSLLADLERIRAVVRGRA